MERLKTTQIPIPEDDLRRISKAGIRLTANNSVRDSLYAVIETANLVELTPRHRAAACNLTCSFIERCRTSAVKDISNIIWTDRIWDKLLTVFLDRSENAKPKSMRQVLLLLVAILSEDREHIEEIKLSVVRRICDILYQSEYRPKVKPALHALSLMLSKQLVGIEQLCQVAYERDSAPSGELDPAKLIPRILSRFLEWVGNHDTAPAAGLLLVTLLKHLPDSLKRKPLPNDTDFIIWAMPLYDAMLNSVDKLHSFKQYVLPGIFKLDRNDYIKFLYHCGFGQYMSHSMSDHIDGARLVVGQQILFTTLRTGKEIGMIKETGKHRILTLPLPRDGTIGIPTVLFSRLLLQENLSSRLSALSLLTSSTSITRPVEQSTFDYLKRSLYHLHCETDANFRDDLVSLLKQFFIRLRASSAALYRIIKQSKDVSPLLVQSTNMQQDCVGDVRSFNSCKRFIQWYLRFLTLELRPTASYQRHITALRVLGNIYTSGLDSHLKYNFLSKDSQGEIKWPYQFSVIPLRVCRCLFDLTMNPFEDIRTNASILLRLRTSVTTGSADPKLANYLDSYGQNTYQQDVYEHNLYDQHLYNRLIKRAETTMFLSARADHADGVAQLHFLRICGLGPSRRISKLTKLDAVTSLVAKLEEIIAIAIEDLPLAVAKYPLHGLLRSLSILFDDSNTYSTIFQCDPQDINEWSKLHHRIFVSLHIIWQCVKPILCNDAPEGYVPEDLEQEDALSTKDILSYSWRALKEASTLLRVIVINAPLSSPSDQGMLNREAIEDLGQLCFTQLAELRHRGAFSTVAQSFASCCQRCHRAANSSIQELPFIWYKQTLECFHDQSSLITRRSAGLPSLMVGVLSADPTGPLLQSALHDLIRESLGETDSSISDHTQLSQVHAMNCIKDIFKNSKLGPLCESFIGEALDLAALKLESNIWAVRNCGLMLFRALIDRLLGTNEAHGFELQRWIKSSKLSFERYPNLLPIVLKLLRSKSTEITSKANSLSRETRQHVVTEGVFPALQIIQKAQPPVECFLVFKGLVFDLLRSSQWHVRDMAARTLALLLQMDDVITPIMGELGSVVCQNELHGHLLAISCFLEGRLQQFEHGSQGSPIDQSFVAKILSLRSIVLEDNKCAITKATYLKIIRTVLKSFLLNSEFNGHSNELFTPQFAADIWPSICGQDSFIGSPALRKEVAQLSILQFFSLSEQERKTLGTVTDDQLTDILAALARRDPDEFCSMLQEFSFLFEGSLPSKCDYALQQMVFTLMRILSGLNDREVKSSCLQFLADAIEKTSIDWSESVQNLPQVLENCMNHITKASPSLVENALRLQAHLIDSKIPSSPAERKDSPLVDGRLINFISGLRIKLADTNPFSSRFAAARSLAVFAQLWKYRASSNIVESTLTVAGVAIYDVMNDDDDEIRDLGASIATKIIAGFRYSVNLKNAVPLVASQRLSEYLARKFTNSQVLCEEALRHLIMTDPWSNLFEDSVEERLRIAREENSALFMQEKQNLFIDEAREAVIWSRVLKKLSAKAIPRRLAEEFTQWVMDGLVVLTETARTEEDGPLGWTSKADVYALGIQVIYGADVLLEWRKKTRKVTVSGPDIRCALRKFADIGEKNELHDLWLERIEEVLSSSILGRLITLKDKMKQVGIV
ncbi:hypothetical protein M501DRAFT_939156 [Patellaria atrata CBS 101060]|uniref:DUF2428 domain-containing protein n=1 Tax=Patellaria atrata CBS 101060 TaxID=1346257 RepID=A0A9P4S7W7_9PEZI|nr:hypothetical protein M501DRAFT_939156 [Patellaria atrata CBS 101060]